MIYSKIGLKTNIYGAEFDNGKEATASFAGAICNRLKFTEKEYAYQFDLPSGEYQYQGQLKIRLVLKEITDQFGAWLTVEGPEEALPIIKSLHNSKQFEDFFRMCVVDFCQNFDKENEFTIPAWRGYYGFEALVDLVYFKGVIYQGPEEHKNITFALMPQLLDGHDVGECVKYLGD